MGKTREIKLSRIAGKVRALAGLEANELQVALPSFLVSLDGSTAEERYQEISQALGHQAAHDAVRLGVAMEWVEEDRDPRDICYETWEAEHGEMLETLLDVSDEELDSADGLEEVLDTLFNDYADSFEVTLREELDEDELNWDGYDEKDWVDDDDDRFLG